MKLFVNTLIIILFIFTTFSFAKAAPCNSGNEKADGNSSTELCNPLGETKDLNTFIGQVIKGVLGIVGS